jgi:hypothetical protein
MTHIQSGRVVYGRTVKTGDYESKKFEVELSFNIDDGADASALVDQVGAMAVDKCHQMLGLSKAKTPPVESIGAITAKDAAAAFDAKAAAAAAMNAETTTTKKGPGRPPKTKAASVAADELDSNDPGLDARAEHMTVNGQTVPAPKKEADAAADDFDAPSTEVKEVTDQDLTSAAGRKNKSLSEKHGGEAPVMIRKLRDEFFKSIGVEPLGKQLKDVPKEHRQSFLKKLEALA